MNVKSLLPIVVGALIALIAWQMVIKKLVTKDEYELDDDFEE